MNDSTLADHYEQAAEHYLAIAMMLRTSDRNGKNLTARIADAQVGHLRSPSLEAGETTASDRAHVDDGMPEHLRGKTTYSDPTGTAGVQVALKGDRARDDLVRLRRGGPRAASEAQRLLDDATRYSPRSATVIEQQQEAEPGCVSCSRVDSPGTVGLAKAQRTPWWNAVAREVTLADGSKAPLCEWCRAQARVTGALPEKTDVEAYRDTGRARRKTA